VKPHRLNIFPEATPEEFARLEDDIRTNGFDTTQPITLYQGDVLDGWHRQCVCDELKATATYKEFTGTDTEAMEFVMRTNKRRNLTSAQWAAIAVEADTLVSNIREQVKANQGKRNDLTSGQNCPNVQKPTEPNHTAEKVAEVFNTSATYVKQAAKIKAASSKLFERVKSGHMTMQEAAKAARAIPTDPWLPDEEERKKQVLAGHTVIANRERCKNLIQWAEKKGAAVEIGRGSDFGNPFAMPKDGTRDEVCDKYRDHHLPHKPSILQQIPNLKGCVLICHCYPLRCHGEALIERLAGGPLRFDLPADASEVCTRFFRKLETLYNTAMVELTPAEWEKFVVLFRERLIKFAEELEAMDAPPKA
jgi:hypothetical protein